MDLPEINNLKNISKKIALLDAVIEQDWEYRYYSYNGQWDDSEEMASMRDGEGNHYFILFKKNMCFIKVIDKEKNSINEIKSKLSETDHNFKDELMEFLNEPAFYIDELSFLYWNVDGKWNSIEPDENKWLNILIDPVSEYVKFAENYYEVKLNINIISKIINENVKMKQLLEINPDVDIDQLFEDIEEIGLEIKNA